MATPPLTTEPGPSTGSRFWKVGAAVAAIMVGLAVLGVALTTVDRVLARRYWMWLVPAYGLLCVVTAWYRPRDDALHGLGAVVRQLAHWLTIGGAVALNFWMTGTGEEAATAAGFNALLLLAVGCVLAGVYLSWLFGLVGSLLVLTLVCVVKADQYLWMLFVVAVLVLVVIFVAARLWGRSTADRP
ncbi:MAG TPA: hypothetical protein VLI07_10710 [Candidatus Binatus sp.]|jgi:hypothetical protein|nr:hypothetical protein [Candidatus Binatus sp.]